MNKPLGSTASLGHAGMINLIGDIPDAVRSLEQGVLHDYGKAARPGRKLGHITVTAETVAGCDALVDIISRTVNHSA
jgi:5-(carboxyamino)imidazole ribonucleotide synthase